MSLGEHRQLVPLRQIRQRLGHVLDHFHRLLEDRFREAHHRLQVVRRKGALGKLRIALAKIPAEVRRAIAVDLRVDALDVVQHIPHLLRRHRRMREEAGELIERALEVDVVFPERVVSVDDEVLACHAPYLRSVNLA
jgi:hypothetical protein